MIQDEFFKAKDLAVIVSFEYDDSQEGRMRAVQARTLIGEMILSTTKRGRPAKVQEDFGEAA